MPRGGLPAVRYNLRKGTMTVNDVAPGRVPARNRIRPFIVTRRNTAMPAAILVIVTVFTSAATE